MRMLTGARIKKYFSVYPVTNIAFLITVGVVLYVNSKGGAEYVENRNLARTYTDIRSFWPILVFVGYGADFMVYYARTITISIVPLIIPKYIRKRLAYAYKKHTICGAFSIVLLPIIILAMQIFNFISAKDLRST